MENVYIVLDPCILGYQAAKILQEWQGEFLAYSIICWLGNSPTSG